MVKNLENELNLFRIVYQLQIDLFNFNWNIFTIHVMEVWKTIENQLKFKSLLGEKNEVKPCFRNMFLSLFTLCKDENTQSISGFLLTSLRQVVRNGSLIFYDKICKFDYKSEIMNN